ncbi:hypothetical protein C8A00DRAFT_28784 [Chaetomidium leptoderma]|uniref:Uncharacterized protein n=1 Tax=Chaetomidium leptoderma TaxID=669021 RepID=A0AAN6VUY3_9PEZI|nr:hypothetical protein C8A00DRAFT_28784 [Chaetomidium leptoderma]
MSTAISSNAAAVPHTLTTPFVPPPSCTDQFITTSYTTQSSVITVLASGAVDPRFAACQPSGWDAGTSSFEFSPAVCPSGWAAYYLGVTTSYLDAAATRSTSFTTAYCCSSRFRFGFVNSFPVQGIPPEACYQNLGTEPGADEPPSTGLRAHNAWHISWASSDIPSLSPTPPALPCPSDPSVMISSWTPGATVDPSLSSLCNRNNGESTWSSSDAKSYVFVVVGLPLIAVAIIATWFGCWCHRRARRHRAKLERAAALQLASSGGGMSAGDQERIQLRTAGSEQPKET